MKPQIRIFDPTFDSCDQTRHVDFLPRVGEHLDMGEGVLLEVAKVVHRFYGTNPEYIVFVNRV